MFGKPTFTASEAALLTGASQMQQRDMRRFGFLPPKGQGWTRFDIDLLSQLFILRVFADAGRVGDGKKPASEMAGIVASHLESFLDGRATDDELSDAWKKAGKFGAIIWSNGDVETFIDVHQAIDEAGPEKTNGLITLIFLDVVALPFAIRVRDFVRDRQGGKGVAPIAGGGHE